MRAWPIISARIRRTSSSICNLISAMACVAACTCVRAVYTPISYTQAVTYVDVAWISRQDLLWSFQEAWPEGSVPPIPTTHTDTHSTRGNSVPASKCEASAGQYMTRCLCLRRCLPVSRRYEEMIEVAFAHYEVNASV